MVQQAIESKNYIVRYSPETSTLNLQGSLRLSGIPEYTRIEHFLNQAIEQEPPTITMNLRELQFLNSSGIGMLSKFVIKVREKNNIQMVVKGSDKIPWQGKCLKNLQRLMPGLKLEFDLQES